MPESGGGPPNERAVRVYVVSLVVSGAILCAAAVWLLALDGRPHGAAYIATIGLLFGTLVVLQRYGVTFYWKGHRMTTQLDEIAVFVGFVMLPGPHLVLLIPAAAVVVHYWVGRAPLKGAFNVASYAFAAGAGVALNEGLLVFTPTDPIVAASLATALYVIVANFLLAGVFALLERANPVRVFVERLSGPTAASALIGAAGGTTVLALFRVHPIALAALAPFGYLLWRFGALSAQADRELSVHRSLAAVTHDLVGSTDMEAAGTRLLDVCGELLNAGRVVVVLSDGRSWARDFDPAAPQFYVGQTLVGRGGENLGEIRVHPRKAQASFGELERELLRVIAGQAASAIENAKTLAAFEAARMRLELTLSTAQDAVLLVRPDGRIAYVNAAAQALLGIAEPEGCRATDFFDHPILTLRERLDRPALVETAAHDRSRTRRLTVEANVAPVREKGMEGGLLAVVRDVTERKRLEEETARQRDILVRQEKLSTLGTLVAGVAHEVNNPIAFMKANLDLTVQDARQALADPNASADAKQLAASTLESFEAALRAVHRIETITSSLKTVARQGKGKQNPEDLNAVVQDVLHVLKAGTPRYVKLEGRLDAELPKVLGNASQLHQVILNLVKNAVEAIGKEEGRVEVRTLRADGEAVVEVEDDGPGIPVDVLQKLFQPFHTTKDSGTGLGLSISREIVRAHGGEIDVASRVGEGTTFRVRIPLAPAEPASAAP